jgi:hypothetical protein
VSVRSQHLAGSRTGCPGLASGAFDPARPLSTARLTGAATIIGVGCRGRLACTLAVSVDTARSRGSSRAGGRKVRASGKVRAASRRKQRRLVVARGRAHVPGGKRGRVRAKLTKAGRKRLRGVKRARA